MVSCSTPVVPVAIIDFRVSGGTNCDGLVIRPVDRDTCPRHLSI